MKTPSASTVKDMPGLAVLTEASQTQLAGAGVAIDMS